MTEHKFTDEEIIKALECCSELTCVDYCPLKKVDHCESKMCIAALDLINRQKEEIENLTKDRYIITPDGRCELLPRTDINKISASAAAIIADIKEKGGEIERKFKSDVVKAFAERLKTYYRNIDKTAGALIEYTINQKVREFLEGG